MLSMPVKDLIQAFFKDFHLGKVFAVRLRRPAAAKNGRSTQRSSTTTHHELDDSIPVEIPSTEFPVPSPTLHSISSLLVHPGSPTISSATSSRGDSSARKASDMTQTFLPFIKAIADAIPLVGAPIKATIGGLLEIFEVMDRHGQNKVDLDSLASRLDRLRLDLCNAPRARDHCERSRREHLTSMLLDTSTTLTQLRKRSLAYPSVTQDIAGCFTRIDRYLADYLLSSQMQNGGDIHEVLTILQRQHETLMRIESAVFFPGQTSVGPIVTLGFVTLVDATGRLHPIPMDVCDSFERFNEMLQLLLKHHSVEARIQRWYVENGQYDLCMDDDKQVTRLTSREWPSVEAGAKIIMRVVIEQQTPSYSEVSYRCPFCRDLNHLDVGPIVDPLKRQADCPIDCRKCKQRFYVSRGYSDIKWSTRTSNIDSNHTTNVERRPIRNVNGPSRSIFSRVKQFFGLASRAPFDQEYRVDDIPASQTPIANILNESHPISDAEMRLIRNFHVLQTISNSSSALCIIQLSNILRYTNLPTASGGLSDVYKCTWNCGPSSDEVAVKSPRFPNLSDPTCAKINKMLDREIYIWAPLKHQYVLPLHGIVEGFGPFRALVSPWMPNGTLKSYLAYAHETLSMMDRLRLLEQITEGLRYLHDNDVIHGDLTSNNVLVAADGTPRLADFGISNIMVQSKLTFDYHGGAQRWAAPELQNPLEDQPLQTTKSTDIYSLGGIMLEVLYGKQPYWWLMSALHVHSARLRHCEPINFSIEIQPSHLNFMRWCWSTESEVRPSVEEVLNYLQYAMSNEILCV